MHSASLLACLGSQTHATEKTARQTSFPILECTPDGAPIAGVWRGREVAAGEGYKCLCGDVGNSLTRSAEERVEYGLGIQGEEKYAHGVSTCQLHAITFQSWGQSRS